MGLFGEYRCDFATASPPKAVGDQINLIVEVNVPASLQDFHGNALAALDRRAKVWCFDLALDAELVAENPACRRLMRQSRFSCQLHTRFLCQLLTRDRCRCCPNRASHTSSQTSLHSTSSPVALVAA